MPFASYCELSLAYSPKLVGSIRLAVERWWFNQIDHHHLPGLCRSSGAFGNQHILAITLVLRCDKPYAALLEQAANDGLRRPLDYLDDPTLGSSFAIATNDTDLDAVLVQHCPHLVRGQINIGLTVIAGHKTMAIAMALDNSFNFVQQCAGST